MITIAELKLLKEAEHKIEFKEAKGGNFSYNGGSKPDPKDRRRCVLGYVTALANEGGGYLVFGIHDKHPHQVTGSTQSTGATGKLEQDIYRDKGIRVETAELYEDDKRVLVIKVPGRPVGKVFRFEDVPLMRVGEELLPMSDEQYLKIVQEQEPDFSATICPELSLQDLDERALLNFQNAYARKQENPLFLTLPISQCLTDLHLLVEGRLTYAALILLGNKEAIRKYLPQSAINLEYRNGVGQITFDSRTIIQEPYFIGVDTVWEAINLRNGKVPVQEGPYIFDIPYFNKEVIREGVNNAVAHRDYRRQSEVVIKQFPQSLHIINAGGFPQGVSLQNLLTVPSTPRNRLLADVLAKTGIVERSGQGVDKIFFQSLAEAKGLPDYGHSDNYQVELRLSSVVQDKAFALFINQLQAERKDGEKLSVREIITLDAIRLGESKEELDKTSVEKLLREELIEKIGRTNNQKLRLSKKYYSFTNKEAKYTSQTPVDDDFVRMKIIQHLEQFKRAKIGSFVQLFDGLLTREQVKFTIYKLSNKDAVNPVLDYSGNGYAREYFLSPSVLQSGKIIGRALELGMEEMRKRGEFEQPDDNPV